MKMTLTSSKKIRFDSMVTLSVVPMDTKWPLKCQDEHDNLYTFYHSLALISIHLSEDKSHKFWQC